MKLKRDKKIVESTNAVEIAQLKAIGYKPVDEAKAPKAKAEKVSVSDKITEQLDAKEADKDASNPTGGAGG